MRPERPGEPRFLPEHNLHVFQAFFVAVVFKCMRNKKIILT